MLIQNLLNLVFPRFCLSCRHEGEYCCPECLEKMVLLEKQQCPNCRMSSCFGAFCSEKCRAEFAFDELVVCMDYLENATIKRLIYLLKYNFAQELAALLAGIMARQLRHFLKQFEHHDTVIVPVALHKSRVSYRGFNQALSIARFLQADFSKMLLLDCLIRKEERPEQAKLKKGERMINLAGIFEVKGQYLDFLRSKTVILVDDVATTCSTLNECSRALKEAGVKKICGLVLARGQFSAKS